MFDEKDKKLKTNDIHEITDSTTMQALVTSLNNGSSIWTIDTNKNDGYPILANNRP